MVVQVRSSQGFGATVALPRPILSQILRPCGGCCRGLPGCVCLRPGFLFFPFWSFDCLLALLSLAGHDANGKHRKLSNDFAAAAAVAAALRPHPHPAPTPTALSSTSTASSPVPRPPQQHHHVPSYPFRNTRTDDNHSCRKLQQPRMNVESYRLQNTWSPN